MDLPELESLSLKSFTINNNDNFGYSLSRCPKLICYAVWGLRVPARCFAHRLMLPCIEEISLSFSADVNHLVFLYAPKLNFINLLECYNIESIRLLNHLSSSMDWLTTHYPDVAERINNGDPAYGDRTYNVLGFYPKYEVNTEYRFYLYNLLTHERCGKIGKIMRKGEDSYMYGSDMEEGEVVAEDPELTRPVPAAALGADDANLLASLAVDAEAAENWDGIESDNDMQENMGDYEAAHIAFTDAFY
jgi:hypothetical protein